MFWGVFPPIVRISMTAVAASGFTFLSWWQPCCFRGQAGRPVQPWTQHGCHHDTKVKPEAATAVIELLMMDGKKPETCWAANKRQDNELENCCIWLVIYLNCTMMHGLTNLKFKHRDELSSSLKPVKFLTWKLHTQFFGKTTQYDVNTVKYLVCLHHNRSCLLKMCLVMSLN